MVDHPKRGSGEFPAAVDPEAERLKELSRSSGQGYGEIRSFDDEQREAQVVQVRARFAFNRMRPEDVTTCETIYKSFSELAEHIVRTCPDNRERATALTDLITARMHAIAALTAPRPTP